jgi:DNA helicase-2/ATP-dependent DNA helicase PcrA
MKKYILEPVSGTPNKIDWDQALNPQQKKVVFNAEGPSLVLAGAGSGKTRVLIYRLAYLKQQGQSMSNIALLTFTNKAAREMVYRAEQLLGLDLGGLWVGTFHHVANRILRREAKHLGYSSNFTIADKEDSKDLIDEASEELGYKKSTRNFPKKGLISTIFSLAVNSQVSIESIISERYPHLQEYSGELKNIWRRYTLKKKNANLMDFNDLLNNWLKLLQNQAISEKYCSIFKYILVDEYQDTNRLQFEILKKLSQVHRNILAVGDDAQSIYSFRAANIKNLLDFPRVFKGAKIFKLETNYRSTPQILNLANHIIENNKNQFPKKLKTTKKPKQLPIVTKARDVYQQAKFVAQRLTELNTDGVPLNQIAILFRSRFQIVEMEVELMKRNIPYVVRGGLKFFEQAHIKDIFAYLKTVTNPQDKLSFKRALCLHPGIGRGYSEKIWQKTQQAQNSWQNILKTLPKRQQKGFREFSEIIREIKHSSSAEAAIEGLIQRYKEYCYLSFDNSQDRILDLEELAKMSRDFTDLNEFVTSLSSYENFKGESLISSADDQQTLLLSTIHQAKGLEWEVVFLIGFSDYEFPHPKALNTPEEVEEERRLFYVATTRAKSHFYMCYPQNKYTFKHGQIISRASMFFYELPPELYEQWDIAEAGEDNLANLI